MATIARITTGFLTGNFGDPINARATADAWESALREKYPGAEVEVRWQNAEGSKPHSLKTVVEFDDGTCEDEGMGVHGYCEEIDYVLEKVEPVWASE